MTSFRFVFMADCQLGCYATFSGMDESDIARFAARGMRVRMAPSTQGYAWDAERYRRAVDAAGRLRPDFVVMGGDMVDDPTSADQFAELVRITGRLDGVPMHWVPGNHDAAPDAVVPTAASLRRYRQRFGPDRYVFQHKGTTCIAVNTVVWQHPELVPDEWEQQLAFLEAALEAARQERSDHVLLFGHHPLFTVAPDEPDSYWNIPLERRRRILDLLHAHRARAFFCGHWHRNGGGWDRGLEVVVTGPVGYPLGEDPSGFRVVDVDAERIRHRYVWLDASGRTGSLPGEAERERAGERRAR
jgi:3',5'-cyclic AMP phosphodiesterase CpdA